MYQRIVHSPSSRKKFSVYPNPSCGRFVIESDEKRMAFVASNLLAQQFSTQKKEEVISLSPVAGMYLITVIFENGSRQVQRLVRQ
jgi:hypothetical protein